MKFDECIHGDRAGNFDHYVSSKATRTKFETRKDYFGKIVETTVYYRGAAIIGKMLRDSFGYRYFLRR
jgi:hypothetical protein